MKKKEKITDKSIGVIYARYSPGPNQTEQSIEGQVRDGPVVFSGGSNGFPLFLFSFRIVS